MKKMMLNFFVFVFMAVGYAQNEYPKSIVNVGVGLGGNYGGIGTKTIVGYKNSGLLIGLGTGGDGLWYEIGGQISYKWMYVNLGYGVIGTASNELTNNTTELIKGKMFTLGAMINLAESKKYFLDLGIGYDWDGTYTANGYTNEKDKFNTLDAAIGFGVRF